MYSHASLDRLEDTYELLVSATLSDVPPDAQAILALRQRFAVEFGSLLLALDDDLHKHRNRTKHDELQDRVKTVRIRLMSYTLAWQPAQIEENPQSYREAAQAIADLVHDFIVETRSQVDQLAEHE